MSVRRENISTFCQSEHRSTTSVPPTSSNSVEFNSFSQFAYQSFQNCNPRRTIVERYNQLQIPPNPLASSATRLAESWHDNNWLRTGEGFLDLIFLSCGAEWREPRLSPTLHFKSKWDLAEICILCTEYCSSVCLVSSEYLSHLHMDAIQSKLMFKQMLQKNPTRRHFVPPPHVFLGDVEERKVV